MGAIDGKHIAIIKPSHSGSLYYNYKGFYSIVLLAIANANKEFIMVDSGINGRISDGGVLFHSKFGELYEQDALKLPQPKTIPNTPTKYPHFFIGDEAFALKLHLMKPYPQGSCNDERQNFNKRLSRARCVVENAFGILSSRFGIFQKSIYLSPKKATIVTMACCYLHNFLMKENHHTYAPTGTCEDSETCSLPPLQRSTVRNSPMDAKAIRNQLCEYYWNEGRIL